MALCRQVIDLVGLHLLQDPGQAAAIGQIAVMENEVPILHMWILVQVVNAIGIEQRRTPLDAVHLVTLLQEELSQIGSILPGHTSNKSLLHFSSKPAFWTPCTRDSNSCSNRPMMTS
jgi:hypothetical protein